MDDTEIDERTGLKKKPPSGYLAGLMNHIKCCVGSGIFALGFAFKNAGMLLGPPILIILGLIQLHCQHLLLKAGKEVEKGLGRKPDFADTGRGVFEYGPEKVKHIKKCMQIFSNFVLVLTQTGICCIYIVFFANSMQKVAEHHGFEAFSIQVWVLIALVPILLTSTTLGNLKLLGWLSFTANCLVGIGILITIYLTSTDLPEEFTFDWIGDMTKLPMFISIGLLAFTAIQVVLPIYIEAKKPEQVNSTFGVLNMATAMEVFITILVGILSYMKYGKDCEGSVTLNFEISIPSEIVNVCVGVAVMLSYTLNSYIVIEALYPLMVEKWGPFRLPIVSLLAFKVIYVLLTFIIAWTIPLLGQLVALVGAFGNTSLSVLFPAFFHLVIMWEKSSIFIRTKDFLIIALGLFTVIAGVTSAIMDIVAEIHKVYNPEPKSNATQT